MKERPILFSGPMIRAILDGRKTQTRRVVVPTMTPPRVAPLRMEPWLIDGEQETDEHGYPCWAGFHPDYPGEAKWFTCPYGAPGDRLWVRETWNLIEAVFGGTTRPVYRASPETYTQYPGIAWRPSIFMPRALSRIQLDLLSVRVERVQDITEADAIAEGACVDPERCAPYYQERGVHRRKFEKLWDDINGGKRGMGWVHNPWCWVLTFKRVRP